METGSDRDNNAPMSADPIKLPKIEIDGIAVSNALPGETASVLRRAALTSDAPGFYTLINSMTGVLSAALQSVGETVLFDQVSAFLLVVRPDRSADLYIDGFALEAEMLAKRNVEKGEAVALSKIGDVRRVRFPNVNILPEHQVVACFKVGWKFAFFYDLNRPRESLDGEPLDIDNMQQTLAHLYRLIQFQGAYEATADEQVFDLLVGAGWFPFIEILGSEFDRLSRAYQSDFNVEGQQQELLKSFDSDRLDAIADGWWENPILSSRREILEPAVAAFKRGDAVSCLKILLTEIEGVIRDAHIAQVGRNARFQELLTFAVEQGVTKSEGETSVFFPRQFLRYLKDYTYANFDPATGKGKSASRHSISHGAATRDAYTLTRSLQALLTLDQIRFYL